MYRMETNSVFPTAKKDDFCAMRDYSTPCHGKSLAVGGYSAFFKAVTTMKSEQVIDEVKTAKLRGRGSAGFSTGISGNVEGEKLTEIKSTSFETLMKGSGDYTEPTTKSNVIRNHERDAHRCIVRWVRANASSTQGKHSTAGCRTIIKKHRSVRVMKGCSVRNSRTSFRFDSVS